MTLGADTNLIAAILNIVSVMGNVYWSIKLKSIQGNSELLRSLRESNADKDEIIKTISSRKNQYKQQYFQQLKINKQMEGELQTYKRFNDHPPVDL
jgi:hypothetical protein